MFWRHRRILGEVVLLDGTRSGVFAFITPDSEVYLEDYSGEDLISAVFYSGSHSALPPGIPRVAAYKPKRIIPAVEIATAMSPSFF